MSWADGPVLSFDLETTSVNAATARICSFALLAVDGQREYTRSEYRLVNPGVDVPAGALAVHGLTDEQLREEGMDHDQAVYYLNKELHRAAELAIPVVVFNARYDVTLLYARSRDLGLGWPGDLFIVDPLTLDRGLNKSRVGSRKLGLLASAYGVQLNDAHDAAADARASALLAFAMAERHPQLKCSAKSLMAAQKRASARWVAGYQRYSRKRGRKELIETGWPILDAVR